MDRTDPPAAPAVSAVTAGPAAPAPPGAPAPRVRVPAVAPSRPARERATRVTARAASASGPILLMAAMAATEQASGAPPWWKILVLVQALAVIAWIPASWWGSFPTMLATTCTILLLSPVLTLTSPLVLPGSSDALPGMWALEPLAIGAAALTLPLGWAYAYATVSALSVPAQILLLGVPLDPSWLGGMSLHLSNIIFVTLLDSMRTQLEHQFTAEEFRRSSLDLRARSLAWQRERNMVDGLIHDEVLATLLAAAQGIPGIEAPLADQARDALDLLRRWGRGAWEEGPGPLAPSVREEVRDIADTFGADFVCTTDVCPTPPANVSWQLTRALHQALRNCALHAPGARVEVRLDQADTGIVVTVTDDGPGFDPAAVPPQRLGIRTGIRGRMGLVPGGSALVQSAPGQGARVVLTWRPPRGGVS